MKKQTIIGGILGLTLGMVILVFGVDFMSKPSNIILKFDPVDAFSIIYFSGIYAGGVIGGIITTIILMVYGSSFYYIGSMIHKKFFLKS